MNFCQKKDFFSKEYIEDQFCTDDNNSILRQFRLLNGFSHTNMANRNLKTKKYLKFVILV